MSRPSTSTIPPDVGHPIAVVVARTGASEHLLRVWERRYGAVTPTRGEGGHRRYSDADIERLRLLFAVTRGGRPIGQVARLPTEALSRLAEADAAAQATAARAESGSRARDGRVPGAPSPATPDPSVEQAMALTRALDAPALDDLLRRAVARLGVPGFLEHVVTPLMRAVDEGWRAGRLGAAQERLAASTVHDLLVETMRALARGHGRGDASHRLVLATPPGASTMAGGPTGSGAGCAPGVAAVEAAAAGAAAAADGWGVVYLGPDLPAGEVAAVAAATAARAVAVHVPGPLVADDARARVAGEVRALRARLPAAVPVLVSGAGAPELAASLAGPGIRFGAGWADLRAALTPPGEAPDR
jgi:DNA-binding transcriptional MerR regulator